MSPRILISRLLVMLVYGFSRIFYRHQLSWVSEPPPDIWTNQPDLCVFAFLNHTSLLEPLFLGAFPLSFLLAAAGRATMPGADITMNRPLIGRFYRFLSPRTVAITRKRDASWQHFLDQIPPQSLVVLAPEGRMMRPGGLDKEGRGGIADILRRFGHGRMVVAYSGGLHHVNRPGEHNLCLFKTLNLKLEVLDIADYLASFGDCSANEFRLFMARDLEVRLALHKPV
ncbi:MAG: hypothetical protein ACAI44_10060 [Candidatus Sericytochromatia bacterium]